MNSWKDNLAIFAFVAVGGGMALGGGTLFTSMPDGHHLKAIGLALALVGFIILAIFRFMRRNPHL